MVLSLVRITIVRLSQMFQIARKLVIEFCSKTTIHGVRYFSERNRHWTERCWWIIAIGVSLWFCTFSIQKVWIKWSNNPVIMSVYERQIPISEIPFPTVTICPEIKTTRTKLDLTQFGISNYQLNFSPIEIDRIKVLLHLCYNLRVEFDPSVDQYANASLFSTIMEMAPILDDTVRLCNWLDGLRNCSDLFVPIITEEGLCFSFNALNSNEIYTDEMAQNELMMVTNRPKSNLVKETGYRKRKFNYPMNVYSAKQNAELGFTLRSLNMNVEYVCRTLVPGYKLFLHAPFDALRSTDSSIRVPFAEEINVSIIPKIYFTAETLRDYKPNQRKCFFESERKLRFFKSYSRANCETECLANYTLDACGCVKFSMPRAKDTKICGPTMIPCYRNAQKDLFGQDIIEGLIDENAIEFREKCNCIPGCSSIKYDAEVDRAKFDFEERLTIAPNSSTNTIIGFFLARLNIFFQYHEISAFKRKEQYTSTDFYAICGGILGLCLGISVLSILECIYFFTLHLFWTIRKWKGKNAIVPLHHTKSINHVFIDMPNI